MWAPCRMTRLAFLAMVISALASPAYAQRVTFSQITECRCRERMVFAERNRMDCRNVEFIEEHHHVTTDEGDIHVACSWSITIERLVRMPLVSCDRAAAKNYPGAIRCRIGEVIDELLVESVIATEDQMRNAFTNFALPFWSERGVLVFGKTP